MIDIDKLRYDLAMNCALVQVLDMDRTTGDFRASAAMVEAFKSAYKDLATRDMQHLAKIQKEVEEAKKHAFDSLKTIK